MANGKHHAETVADDGVYVGADHFSCVDQSQMYQDFANTYD